MIEDDSLLSILTSHDASEEIETVDDFLNSIENQNLYRILLNTDKFTLQMLLMKLNGYSVSEISRTFGMKQSTVYKRLSRLRAKIEKALEFMV